MKEKINNVIRLLKERRRIVISNPSTFQQKFAVNLTKGAYFSLLAVIVLIIAVLTYLVISYTSLKKFIPGYPNVENAEMVYETDQANIMYLSEVESATKQRDLWIKNLQNILSGNDSLFISHVVDSIKSDSNYKNIVFERPIEDSLIRVEVEQEDKLIKEDEIKGMLKRSNFLIPVSYNHFSSSSRTTTFLTQFDAPILSCMQGSVISKTNNMILVQHSDDFLSIYKNCRNVNVKIGDQINRGKEIATVRDSVLSFELWHEGKPINIKEVSFE